MGMTWLRTPLIRKLRLFLPGAVLMAIAWAGFSQPAAAVVTVIDETTVNVTEVGDTFVVEYTCLTTDVCGDAGSPDTELTATTTWTVTSISADGSEITFEIVVSNTTSDPGSTTNRITEFGVVVLDPDATAATADTGWTAMVDTNFPTFMTIDLVVEDDGTGASGVGEGESDTLVLTLMTDGNINDSGQTLQIFPIKYQGVGINGESFEFAGTVPDEPFPVPEPSSLLLFGTGLIGLTFMVRRRRFQPA